MTNDGCQAALSCLASHGRWHAGDIAPRAESSIASAAVFTGGQAVTAKLKVIVDPAVVGKKTLGVTP